MKTHSVQVCSGNEIKKVKLTSEMLLELIEAIQLNGEEMIHTSKGSYMVDGVYIGSKKVSLILEK